MTPVLQITGVEKRYQSLRPLRIQELTIAAAERVAVSGFDAGAAEVLVNLVTGASLPDRGEVRVLGHRTADIVGGDEWLASLDRFGIVSPRGVLLEAATIEQNLAMPLTLEIDPVPPDVAARVVDLARPVRHHQPDLAGKTACGGLPGRLLLRSVRVFIWRERSRSGRRCWSWSMRVRIWPRKSGSRLPTVLLEWRTPAGLRRS